MVLNKYENYRLNNAAVIVLLILGGVYLDID